jgi:serine/threonine protein kinase
MRHSRQVPGRNPNDGTLIERIDPLLGEVLDGKYRLEMRIASGGFGAIYQATHVGTGAELAVKVVHARLASDPGIVARFQREGEALTTLRSPHTITAYELGETSEGVLYIAMELLHGATLYQRFRDDGPLPWRRMVEIALGVCDSLAEAHALGIVHRDLKPTNIFLERRGGGEHFVKVLDFGIAKILQHSSFDNTDLTSAGLMIGTIDYMSPEQMVGGEITGATDLYTLGIVIYEMIAGKRPFPEAPSAASVLAAMLKPAPPLKSKAIVPVELDRIVMRCLERDAMDRYQTAEELAADLARLLDTPEARRRSFDPDEDATQIAPPRVSATVMAAAAPPPALPPPLPMSPPPLPPLAANPRPIASAPTLMLPPLPAAAPAPMPMPPSMPSMMLPSQGSAAMPPALGPLPLAPVDTLRGVAIPHTRDSARTNIANADSSTVRRQYDAGLAAQRDAMVRRLVWISAFVILSLIGAALLAWL